MLDLPPTDIIVITYNARTVLDRCLRSVIRHTKDTPYRLTVVDNASTDGTSAHLNKHFKNKFRLIQNKQNLGFSGGANVALGRTNHPWIALLDDDVEVTPGWLKNLYRLADKYPDVGIVGGKVVFPNNRLFCAEFRIVPFQLVGWQEPDRGQRDYIKEVDALPGPCWLMPRHVVKKVGRFDEQFFPSQCEDIDYCIRVRLAGYKVLYHGKVKIIHHHLYRVGSPEKPRVNDLKFLKKWGKTLDKFPLCPLSPHERLLAKGSKILEKEKFLSYGWILGNLNRLGRRLPDAFYRGVAFWSSGKFKKAVREFRTVWRVYEKFQIPASRQVSHYYFLSVFFERLKLKREARRCMDRLMNVMDHTRNGSFYRQRADLNGCRAVFWRLHHWTIRISTDDERFFDVLKNFFSYYWDQCLDIQTPMPGTHSMEICFSNGIGRKDRSIPRDTGLVSVDWLSHGIRRALDPKNRLIYVTMDQKRYFKDNYILHGSFLWPLTHLLRLKESSLVHGALLEKKGQGVLILGVKGSGKSTLSTVCLSQGYRYFSDEHPILEIGAERVYGRSFISSIALPAVSARKNFPGLMDKMVWSETRKKYILRPETVWPDRMGESTMVTKVIFPRFTPGAGFSVKKLSEREFSERLLQDEYLSVTLAHEKGLSKPPVPRRIIKALCRSARGFMMEYSPADILKIPSVIENL